MCFADDGIAGGAEHVGNATGGKSWPKLFQDFYLTFIPYELHEIFPFEDYCYPAFNSFFSSLFLSSVLSMYSCAAESM